MPTHMESIKKKKRKKTRNGHAAQIEKNNSTVFNNDLSLKPDHGKL